MIEPITFAARWQNPPQPSDWPEELVWPGELLALVKADEQAVQDKEQKTAVSSKFWFRRWFRQRFLRLLKKGKSAHDP